MRRRAEELSFKQSPENKSFKEMVAALEKDTLPSSDSEEEFESDFRLLVQKIYFSKDLMSPLKMKSTGFVPNLTCLNCLTKHMIIKW